MTVGEEGGVVVTTIDVVAVTEMVETCRNEVIVETMVDGGAMGLGRGLDRHEMQRGAGRRPLSLTAMLTVQMATRSDCEPTNTITAIILRDDPVLAEAQSHHEQHEDQITEDKTYSVEYVAKYELPTTLVF